MRGANNQSIDVSRKFLPHNSSHSKTIKTGYYASDYEIKEEMKMLSGLIDFENKNALAFVLRPTNNGVGYIEELSDFFNKDATTDKQYSIGDLWETNMIGGQI